MRNATHTHTHNRKKRCEMQRSTRFCTVQPGSWDTFCYKTPQKPMRKQKQSSNLGEESAKTRVSAHASKGIAPPHAAADATTANNNSNNNNYNDNDSDNGNYEFSFNYITLSTSTTTTTTMTTTTTATSVNDRRQTSKSSGHRTTAGDSILCGKQDAGPRNQISENCARQVHKSSQTQKPKIPEERKPNAGSENKPQWESHGTTKTTNGKPNQNTAKARKPKKIPIPTGIPAR